MSTTETKIGKHDVLCSSLNFATPRGAAKCDCNLSVMADMLEALELATLRLKEIHNDPNGQKSDVTLEKCMHAIAKAKGGVA